LPVVVWAILWITQKLRVKIIGLRKIESLQNVKVFGAGIAKKEINL
jgi:hypothetical protein